MRKLLAGNLNEKKKSSHNLSLNFYPRVSNCLGLLIYKLNCLFIVIQKFKYEEESVSLYMSHYLISSPGLQSLLLTVGNYLHIRTIKKKTFLEK